MVTTAKSIGRKAIRASEFVQIKEEVGGLRVRRKFVPDDKIFDYVHERLERALKDVHDLQERELAYQGGIEKSWSVQELCRQFLHDSSDYVGTPCKESDISCNAMVLVSEAFAVLRYVVGEEIFTTEFIGNYKQIDA